MGRTATGIDIGGSTVKLIRGEVKDSRFIASAFHCAETAGETIASGWEALEGLKPTRCRIGLSGRDVNIRYMGLPRLPDWQLRKLMRLEAEDVGGQSESSVASDFNVLPEIPEVEGDDVVLLAMAREALLAEHMEGLGSIGGKLDAFTPNSIGLYNAFLHYGVVMEDTVLLANIGRENLDVIILRGPDLLFARNMSGGSKLFDDAVAQRFEIDRARAERYKIDSGRLDLGGQFKDANQEKAARAMTAPAGQLLSLLQSAVVFAKGQVKLTNLKVDRVFLCGGGAALRGLPEYIQEAMGVPTELFDPFAFVDSSKLDEDSADLLEAHKLEAVAALGLATCGSDPDAYSIEILPDKVRKKRDFMNGPAFLIAAAALALLYLGFHGFQLNGELGELTEESALLDGRFRRADATHRKTTALVEENARLEEFAHELFALKGSGEQMVRTLDVIERELPVDFWLETMSIGNGFDEDLNVDRADERPIMRFSGRSREGTDSPTALWEEFIADLRAGLGDAQLKERMGQTDFTLDLTLLARATPADTEASEEAE